MYQSLTGMTKEKDTLSERRGSLKIESSSLKTGNVWELKWKRGRRQRQLQKTIGFRSKQQLCTFITLFSTFLWRPLHDYQTWNVLMRRFMEDVNIRGRNFPFSFCSWIKSWRIHVQQKSPIFDKFFQIDAIKFERMQIQFSGATPFPLPSSSLLLKFPLVITSECDLFFYLVRYKAGQL